MTEKQRIFTDKCRSESKEYQKNLEFNLYLDELEKENKGAYLEEMGYLVKGYNYNPINPGLAYFLIKRGFKTFLIKY